MKTVIITQARMTSTRLPGKVMKKVLGKPLLEYHIERLKRVRTADEIIVATTGNDVDDVIVTLAREQNIGYYRGSEEDVLLRYYEAAKEAEADVVVRVTSDCPLIDPEIVDLIIKFYQDNIEHYDYVSNTLRRTYPRGMDTEVFGVGVLNDVHERAKSPVEREHVTRYIYAHPELYRLGCILHEEDLSGHRWTVDTEEDFRLIRNIIEELYPEKPCFSMSDCLDLLQKHPEWVQINANVRQKEF